MVPPLDLGPEEFDALVDRALDEIPDELVAAVTNLVVLVEDRPPPEEPDDLLGLYVGTALTERDHGAPSGLPDQVLVFREPLLAMCDSLEELAHEVRVTVLHEVAHHFGLDHDRLEELGYD